MTTTRADYSRVTLKFENYRLDDDGSGVLCYGAVVAGEGILTVVFKPNPRRIDNFGVFMTVKELKDLEVTIVLADLDNEIISL